MSQPTASPAFGVASVPRSSCWHFKRGAELAAFLADEVVEDVGHAQWVFTVPKMLRFYFFRQRELLWRHEPSSREPGPAGAPAS